jgi:multidrug efflux pump subunit AcrA (membrane-fusion protein)
MADVKSYARLWPLAFAAVGVAGFAYAAFQWFRADPMPVDIAENTAPIVDTGPNEHYETVRTHLVDELSTYRGEVKAGSPIPVRAPQGMRVPIKQIHHEQGDFVKKGDVLVSFPREPIDKAIAEAKAKGDTVNEERFRSYLDFVELKAPCDGVVDQIWRTLGEVPIDEGIPVITLQDRTAFRFVVRVPGDVQRQSMALSAKFDVELDDDLGTVKGTVSAFDPPVGTDVPVVLSLEPHEGIADRTAGAVRVASGRIEAGLVPRTAVTKRGDVPIVRVWDPVSKSITERTVKLGETIGPDVVVLGGAFAGDSVVVPGRKPPQ